jgi:hypothetical protein
MVAAADAVVLAKYTGRHSLVEHPVPGVAPRRSTSYSFEVTEILKLHEQLPFAGGEVQIELPGGDKEEPGHIERMRDRETRPLVARDDYVLFLRWNVQQQRFVLPWGAAAIYDVSGGAVTSLRSSWPRHDGTAAKDFLANVRRVK